MSCLKKLNGLLQVFFLSIFLVFSYTSLADANQYSTRPTQEAVEEDLEYCAPLYASAAALVVVFYATMSWTMKIASVATIFAAYGGQRAIIEDWAREYQKNSYVLNHLDANDDMINDYAKWVNLDAINNNAEEYNRYLGFVGNSDALRIRNVSYCDDLVGVTVIKTDQSNGFVYYERTLTLNDVKNFDGCRDCTVAEEEAEVCGTNNNLYGFTYEVYNENYLCSGGVLVYYDGEQSCIPKGSCDRLKSDLNFAGIDFSDYLVCAYKMDELVCSEAVFCSFTIFDGEIDSDDLDQVWDAFGDYVFDFSAIDGRTWEGKDPRDPGVPSIISCQQLIDDSYQNTCVCTNQQASDQLCDAGAYYVCSYDNIETVSSCDFCGDVDDCIDNEGQFIDNCVIVDNQICGYYPNEEYLRHCALDNEIDLEQVYELPDFISKYCSGEAEVDNGNMSIAGRIIRCVELSIQNMFFGAYEEAMGGEITGIYCSNNDQSVSLRSQCQSGIFVQFQNSLEGVISILMTFAISLLGILVLFGLMPDMKQIFSFLVTFSIVFYFAVSDGWRDGYYDAVVTAGRTLGMIGSSSFNYESLYGVDLEDGCGYRVEDTSALGGDKLAVIGNNDYVYPDNEEHYSVWDLYDCKMEKFFASSGQPFSSYGEILERNFVMGLLLAVPTLMALYILVYIFLFFTAQFLVTALSAFFVITLLIFISPLVIPLILLKKVSKARKMFDAWFKTLIGYSFQPLILWLTLGLLTVFLDVALYGPADSMFVTDSSGQFPEGAQIADDCSTYYIPCIFHKLDIGYYGTYSAQSFTSFFTDIDDLFDVTLLFDVGLAFLRALFFIAIAFFICVEAVKVLAGTMFDASLQADVTQELMGSLKNSFKATILAGNRGALAAKNTAENAFSKMTGGSGGASGYFK
ncbi:MAG: type IV secretion system protein [Rickettsiales bacterium]|nr:type IV secretion system protein [Rickettsiales bacterium]